MTQQLHWMNIFFPSWIMMLRKSLLNELTWSPIAISVPAAAAAKLVLNRAIHSWAGVCPVGCWYWSLVLLGWCLIENGKKLACIWRVCFQIDDGIRAVTFNGVDFEVAMKVSCVKPRQRETIAVTGEGRHFRRFHCWSRGSGVKVVEQSVGCNQRKPSTLKWKRWGFISYLFGIKHP